MTKDLRSVLSAVRIPAGDQYGAWDRSLVADEVDAIVSALEKHWPPQATCEQFTCSRCQNTKSVGYCYNCVRELQAENQPAPPAETGDAQ